MKTNEMSELANRIKRQFQLAIGEKMLENYLDVKGERVISDIIFSGSIKSEHINLFPCEIPGSCASEAVFISLSSEKNKKEFTSLKEDQFISLEDVIVKMVQQVLGECAGRNKHVILITDCLNTEILSPWVPVLNQLSNYGVTFEMLYLTAKGEMNLLDLEMFL
jgi:hypothetical protein